LVFRGFAGWFAEVCEGQQEWYSGTFVSLQGEGFFYYFQEVLAMSSQIVQVAERIRGLRTILDISVEEMARVTDVSAEKYARLENGEEDFSFTFLFKCAQRFGVDIGELVTGDVPKLSFYTLVRKGQGTPIKRREGFEYQHMALLLKERKAEPFIVKAPYKADQQNAPIELSKHNGQEFNLVLEGRMKIQLGSHVEYLDEGDAVYYNSTHGHGMIAVDGRDCVFLSVVIPEEAGKVE
jgi:transcriptional regulator with XRE-family HTH domain